MSLKSLTICITAVFVLGLFTLSANALEPGSEKYKNIEELLILTNTKKNLERSLKAVRDMKIAATKQILQKYSKVSPEKQEQFADTQKKVFELMSKELTWEKLKDDYVALYDRHFSNDEIVQLIAFYKTAIGQKMLKEQPLIFRESMMIGQSHVMKIMPQIQKLLKDTMRKKKEQ